VLPVRDAAATIARAVGSIRAQTFAAWELIVIDDGSVDGTREILDRIAREEPRLRVIGGPRAGLVAALNAGLAVADGEFVARMDADDESHPERFAEQIALLRTRPEIGLASCLVEFGGDRAANAGYALHVDWLNSLVAPEDIVLNRFVESPLAHPSVMFRRELIAKHGGYRAGDFPEDYELWLRWIDAGVRMAKVPRALVTWHDAPARLSRTDARYAPEKFYRVKAEWVAREVGRIIPNPPSREDSQPLGRRVKDNAPYPRNVFVWGAGRHTRKRASYLEAHGLRIAGYIDVDAKKTGRGVGGTGLPVVAMENIPPREEAFVLGYVSSRGARELIRAELVRRGFREGCDFLMCA
jgi:glycosyltransferase involved in cell wall biosynthesis